MREGQRSRLLLAAAQAAAELGMAEVTVTAIIARGRTSRRTFYELFGDRPTCLSECFEEAVRLARETLESHVRTQQTWLEQIRAGLDALLSFLDRQPTLGRFALVEASGADKAVLQRRAAVIAELARAVDRGREVARSQNGLSQLTAEAAVNAVLGIVQTRIATDDRVPLASLAGELMAILVRPYLGPSAAAAELARDTGRHTRRRRQLNLLNHPTFRLTYRTVRVLAAIGANPMASNREVSKLSGIADQGQISKLLRRLEGLGLIANHNQRPGKDPNAWRLTTAGAELEQLIDKELSLATEAERGNSEGV